MCVKVSVILPTFNRTKSLVEAAQSVLGQSLTDIELIVVDDASTEDVEGAIRGIQDDRLRFIRRDVNGGASAARNTGLSVAQGDFVAFQDSDDIWLPGKLARQLEIFDGLPNDVGVVTGSKILYGRDDDHNYGPGKVTCAPPPSSRVELGEDQVRSFYSRNRVSLQNALFRSSCFSHDMLFDHCAKANADWEFMVRLIQKTQVYEDVWPVVLAFISNDSISKNPRMKAIGLIRILKKNKNLSSKYRDVYANHLVQIGRMMRKLGKRRWSRRFVLAGFQASPASAYVAVVQVNRRVVGRLAIKLGRRGRDS